LLLLLLLLLVVMTVVVVMILRHTLLLRLLLLVVSGEEYGSTNANMVALSFENLDNGRAVAMLEDDLVTFGAEFKAVSVCPLDEAVATLVSANSLDAHPGEETDVCIVSKAGLIIESFHSPPVEAPWSILVENR
jgi:hypothetical protein